ncbi:flavonoid 3'-monooxygenase [Selaginella moellendorffii]|nr:flavonoid 3'-monooxygenase [Selaginella moellendorffii]|eukprot:XP_002982021.2 flavonoid 3'-monooxygenase [Selaginella moellendorffii]
MEFAQYAVVLLITLLFLVLSFKRRLNLPPSPWGLPLIGHLHLLGRMLHLSFQALSTKYGPIVFLRLGMVPAVVISSPELAKEVLKIQDANFASRPYLIMGEYNFYNFRDIGFVPYGDYWKRMRKLCATELFTVKRIESFQGVRTREMRGVLSELVNAADYQKPINMRHLLTTYVFNVVMQILMSKRFFEYGEHEAKMSSEAEDFKHIVFEITEQMLQFHISEFVPAFMRRIDWKIPEMKRIHARQDKFLQRILDDHKARLESETSQPIDFMDIMLQSLKSEGARGEESVKAIVTELLSGGDTSASLIEWTLLELMHNPLILQKAQEEIDTVVGKERLVAESDFDKLEYLQAIVKEAFRIHPPAPLLIHMSTEACKVAGYDIPKGTSTFVNGYAIGRDPAVWEDALQFKPERFLGNSIDVKGQDFELLPFGAGRRMCPGMSLGLKTAQLLLFNLIHSFDWSFVPGKGMDCYELKEQSGTVLWLETPLEVVVSSRLPKPI